MAMSNLSSFDLDFSYGQSGEKLVEELLTGGKTIEVKRDRKWHATGNLYIEVECWYQRSDSWEPSGLSVTKASYWAFVLEHGVLMVPTGHVRHAIQKYGREITCEIPPNRSKGYLITVENLLDVMKELKDE
jgi:hypothetical protein